MVSVKKKADRIIAGSTAVITSACYQPKINPTTNPPIVITIRKTKVGIFSPKAP